MNHTPGPWIYEDGDVLGGPGGIACVVPLYTANGLGEGKANARLIAAAPDLLAALRTIQAFSWSLPRSLREDDRWKIVDTAIAKAEGKE